ncbi:MAG: type II toxin-antitoxin system Phd/YefM family antitoxin [Melioribacteraceae bacterium]|nr:type II toxin-antitoxin system Phd/YefM family antitoxin [Melioribacteraceae bacterium]
MQTINATNARSKLYKLIDDTHLTNEPIKITGKRGDAILISDDNWKAIQETIYLLSIPNMRESIIEGLNTKIEDCSEKVEW